MSANPVVQPYNKIVSDDLFNQFETYIAFWLVMILCCFGIVTNSFSAVVFLRQGFKDGVNISMMSLTFWDFFKCFAAFVHRVYGPISLASPAAATSWRNMTFPYMAYTPIFAGYVSFALTSYVSIERCVCVTRPLTVKSIFTPRFTLVAVVAISVVVFGAYMVIFFTYEIAYVFKPEFNASVAIYRYNSFYYSHQEVVMVYYKYAGILLPFVSFIILCSCSAVTVVYLRRSSRALTVHKTDWTDKKSFQTSRLSLREKKVVKMLLGVIAVNIGNLLPRIVFYIAQLIEPELQLLKKYNNVFSAVAVCMFSLDVLKAGVNFFLFLTMSSNFKATFYAVVCPTCNF